MIARTARSAADGRALIEVANAARAGDTVTLHGTAVVYEATVLLDLVDEQASIVDTSFVTATAAGPERGTWVATVNIDARIVGIVVHQEEMEEGAASADQRTALVRVGSL